MAYNRLSNIYNTLGRALCDLNLVHEEDTITVEVGRGYVMHEQPVSALHNFDCK